MTSTNRFFRWFVLGAQFVIVFALLFVTACTVYTGLKLPLPAFDDPVKGNEARGTKIKGESVTLENLLSQTIATPTPDVSVPLPITSEQLLTLLDVNGEDGCLEELSFQCYEDEDRRAMGRPLSLVDSLSDCKEYCRDLNVAAGRELFHYAGVRAITKRGNLECFCDFTSPSTPMTECNYPCDGCPDEMCGGFRGRTSVAIAVTPCDDTPLACEIPSVPFTMCDALTTDDKFGMTFTSSEEVSLYTAKALKAMCNFGEELAIFNGVNRSCPVQSLGHHVAELAHTSCDQLQDSDLKQVLQVLTQCAPFIYRETVTPASSEDRCPDVPPECFATSSIYTILVFLVDDNFINNPNQFLTYSQMFVSLNDADDAVDFYHAMMTLEYDVTTLNLVGANPAIVRSLLEEYLSSDVLLFVVSMVLILAMTLLYTHSMCITVALLLDVICSLLLGYFFYFLIFAQTFFPFLNLTAALLVIGLAADDIFLFYDLWLKEKENEPEEELWVLLGRTFKHAALSIFVTSFTTALALYSNFYSSVTFVKNLALFSGTAIICQFVVIITIIPAFIVVEEKISQKCQFGKRLPECCSAFARKVHSLYNDIYGVILPVVINKAYPFWLVLFLLISVGGFVTVFYKPTLKVPETNQLLASGEIPEYYDVYLREYFHFEKIYAFTGIPLSIVWGVIPEDTGDPTNPDDHGVLVYDDTFDLSSRDAQTYMTSFCRQLKRQDFVTDRMMEHHCSMELFNDFMLSPCMEDRIAPCCGQESTPFAPDVFQECFPQFTLLIRETIDPGRLIDTPYFVGEDAVALTMTVESTQAMTYAFPPMESFYNLITDFIESENEEAPTGVDYAFVTSYFRFYDLQLALIYQTYPTVGISLAIAFAFVLLITRNIITSFYSMLTVTLIIFVMIGCLVLLGWDLNVLESVIISTAAGLAIDFVVHYSIAFSLSRESTRAGCVKESLSRVGSSVAMAALTSFLAGAPLLKARVQGFKQFGIFLMVVMSISWLYSTFFFQSLCRFIGPLQNVGQCLPTRDCRACAKSEDQPVLKGDLERRAYSAKARAKLEPMPYENKAFEPMPYNKAASEPSGYDNQAFEPMPYVDKAYGVS